MTLTVMLMNWLHQLKKFECFSGLFLVRLRLMLALFDLILVKMSMNGSM